VAAASFGHFDVSDFFIKKLPGLHRGVYLPGVGLGKQGKRHLVGIFHGFYDMVTGCGA